MRGPWAYAISTRGRAVCRVRALDLSERSVTEARADVHRSFHRVWLCSQKNVMS
jgi:hypothetical protein